MGEKGKKWSEEDELLLGIMEGYADDVIPPLSYFSSNTDAACRKRQKREESWPENSIKGGERPETMAGKYSLLRSMVPTLSDSDKVSKVKIVEDTVSYIKYLEGEKAILESLKKFQEKVYLSCLNRFSGDVCKNNPNSSANVRVSGGATFLEIQLPSAGKGSVAKIVEVLDKHGAEVLEARIRVDDKRMLTFTATVMLLGGTTVEMIMEEMSTL